MTWGIVATTVVSAGVGMYQANQQAKLSKKAMKDANPFGPYRKQYAEQLGALMKDPSSFLKNPLYQAAFGQGTQAVMRGMAGEGFIGSGNFATGLQSFGESFSWNALKDQQSLLSTLSGAAFGPPGSGGAIQGFDSARQGTQDAFGQIGALFGMKAPPLTGSGIPVYPGGGVPPLSSYPSTDVSIPSPSIPGLGG